MCTTDQLRLASAEEEATADWISQPDLPDLQVQTQRGSSMGAVDVVLRLLVSSNRRLRRRSHSGQCLKQSHEAPHSPIAIDTSLYSTH